MKKGFSIAQCKFAGFTDVSSHRQTNDRFIVRVKSPLASAAQIYLLRRKKRLFESCPCRNILRHGVREVVKPTRSWLRRSTRNLAFFFYFRTRDIATSAWKDFGRCLVHPAPRARRRRTELPRNVTGARRTAPKTARRVRSPNTNLTKPPHPPNSTTTSTPPTPPIWASSRRAAARQPTAASARQAPVQ